MTMTTFCDQAWAEIEPIRQAIDELPLLRQLEDGTLDRAVFEDYLAQDAHYLADYARVLALAASQASDPDDLILWAGSALGAIGVERVLHASHVVDFMAASKSAACTAYTAHLLSLGSAGCYPQLIAGVLPCFWIYEDVGRRMLQRLSLAWPTGLNSHPYGDWIRTYADEDFAASTARAKEVVNRRAEDAGSSTRQRMLAAFVTSSRYEWMFWDAPMRLETWPV